jgi:DNA-binding LytR/AlgR family response regulator
MAYTCIAIDDEYPATQIIKTFVDKIPDVELLKTFTKATEALQFLSQVEVDILFLDIQMPDINGIEFSQSLRIKPKIIFTTAYDQYAVEGFNLDAVDYLLKPFSFDRFVKSVNKAVKLIDLEQNKSSGGDQYEKEKSDFIVIKADYKLHKIKYDEIDYIEGLKAYVSFFVKGKRFITLESLKRLEELLPAEKFLRVHKSYIVPFSKVKALEGNMLEMENKKIPIGKSYKEMVMGKVFKKD